MNKPYITIYKPYGNYANYCIHLKDKDNSKNRSISGVDSVISLKYKYPSMPIYDITNIDSILNRNTLYFKDRIK